MLRVHNHNDLHGRCILRESLIQGDVDGKLTTASAKISVAPNESLKLYTVIRVLRFAFSSSSKYRCNWDSFAIDTNVNRCQNNVKQRCFSKASKKMPLAGWDNIETQNQGRQGKTAHVPGIYIACC